MKESWDHKGFMRKWKQEEHITCIMFLQKCVSIAEWIVMCKRCTCKAHAKCMASACEVHSKGMLGAFAAHVKRLL